MLQKIKEFLALLKSAKAINLIVLLVIIAAVPLTVFIAQQQQETRQNAAEKSLSKTYLIPTTGIAPTSIPCSVCRADINKDGKVNSLDYGRLSACWNKSSNDKDPAGNSCADVNLDGVGLVDEVDLKCLQSVYLQTCIVTPTPTAISSSTMVTLKPEASTGFGSNASGYAVVQILRTDYYNGIPNIQFKLRGQLGQLLPNHVYKVYLCSSDKQECATNSSPQVLTNSIGNANFDNIIFTLTNPSNHPIASVRVYDEYSSTNKVPSCPITGMACLWGPYSVSATPIPTSTAVLTPSILVTPTSIPSMSLTGVGSFNLAIGNYSQSIDGTTTIDQQNRKINLVCKIGHPNCSFTATYIPTNRTDKNLYYPTVWVYNPYNGANMLQYLNSNGQLTSSQSVFPFNTGLGIAPNQSALNTYFKVIPPQQVGSYLSTMYIDAKTCNNATTPPDCVFYGGSGFSVAITVNP